MRWKRKGGGEEGGEGERVRARSVNGQKPIRWRREIECRALSSGFYRVYIYVRACTPFHYGLSYLPVHIYIHCYEMVAGTVVTFY